MVETKKCSFTGKPIPPGTGMMYVKKTGQVLYFINSKAKKNYLNLNRVPARTKWTDTARKSREK
jgi:large subunit ribosomal protein L24e